MGTFTRSPADITQAEWDQHRGEVLRLSGELGAIRGKADQAARDLRAVSKQLEVIVNRQSKHSDWRETTGKHDLELLEKELAKFEEEKKWRMALWVKIALIIFGAIASGLIGHFAK